MQGRTAMNEVRIAPDQLRKALAFAASVVEGRITIPVLGMVRLDFASPVSKITGTDLDMEASAEFEVADLTGSPFTVLINPSLLAGAIRYAEGLITINKTGDIITITADDMVMKIREVCGVEDWLGFNADDKYQSSDFSESVLRKAMRAVATSISTKATRYYLNGAFFHSKHDGKLTIVSTDGHRLTKYQTEADWVSGAAMIVPRKACHILTGRLADGGNKTIQIGTHGTLKIAFKGDGWEMRVKCIDGTFPDYTRVIPTPCDNISFALTSAGLRRIPNTGERSRAIKVDPDAGKITHTSYDGITITMPVTGKGGPAGFNIEYLKTFANLSGTIKVTGKNKGDPFRITTEDPNLLHIIMPMQVR